MATVAEEITAEKLLSFRDDGLRRELVRGEVRVMAPANSEHGAVSSKFLWRLAAFVEQNNLGETFAAETGFLIARNPDTVRAPDAAFVRADRIPSGGPPSKFFPGPPDLAFEAVSPGDTVDEVEEKVRDWLAAGTQIVVVAKPRWKTLTIYESGVAPRELKQDDEFTAPGLLPGFSCLVGKVFGS